MSRENAYDKGSRLLAEGRIVVLECGRYGIAAHVRGEGAVYVTRFGFGSWSCTCPALRPTCSHIAALKRITAVDIREHR